MVSLYPLLPTTIETIRVKDEGLQSGAATCSEGFVICFLKVPLTCWGSMVAAVQPNTLRKHFTKPPEKVATPDCN